MKCGSIVSSYLDSGQIQHPVESADLPFSPFTCKEEKHTTLNPLYKLRPHNRPSLSLLPPHLFFWRVLRELFMWQCGKMIFFIQPIALELHAALWHWQNWIGFYMVLIKLFLLCLASSRVNRALIIWTLPGKCKGAPEILRKWTKSVRILASLQHGACQIETKHSPLFSVEDRDCINNALKTIIIIPCESTVQWLNWILIQNDSASWTCTLR